MVIHDYLIHQHLNPPQSTSRSDCTKRIKHVEVQWKATIHHCSCCCNGWVGPQMLQVLIMCYCRGVGIYRIRKHCPQLLRNNKEKITGRRWGNVIQQWASYHLGFLCRWCAAGCSPCPRGSAPARAGTAPAWSGCSSGAWDSPTRSRR